LLSALALQCPSHGCTVTQQLRLLLLGCLPVLGWQLLGPPQLQLVMPADNKAMRLNLSSA
jgi:hypothetical protein